MRLRHYRMACPCRALTHDIGLAPGTAPGCAVGQTMGGRKIVLYTHSLSGGGAERTLALLASGLASRGHDVVFATDYGAPENEGFLAPCVRRADLGRSHARAVLHLRTLLAREQPDVSISALGASNVKHAAAAFLAGRRRRAVLGYHGFYVSEPRRLSQLAFWLAPVLTRVTGRTIAVSAALRDNLVGSWRAAPAQTRHIQNPVAWRAPPQPPTAQDLRARAPLVLAIGRLTADKDFIGLVHAFAKIKRAGARLVILGEGEERAALEAEIARLGLTDQVTLPGYAVQPWTYYECAACFAVSSRSESFGMVIVEALAFGLPVVATDCGGPREILSSPEIGRLVPFGDETAMAAALEAALSDPGDPAPRLARAASFSLEQGLDVYEALIEEIVAEQASHPHVRTGPAARR